MISVNMPYLAYTYGVHERMDIRLHSKVHRMKKHFLSVISQIVSSFYVCDQTKLCILVQCLSTGIMFFVFSQFSIIQHLIATIPDKSFCLILIFDLCGSASSISSSHGTDPQAKDSPTSRKSTRAYRDWIKNSKRLSHSITRKSRRLRNYKTLAFTDDSDTCWLSL